MKKINKPQKGQALILIAIAIVGLVGITGLAIDGGNIYSERRRAQNAADTAALSAALAKVEGNTFTTVANSYISSNMTGGSTVSDIVVSSPPTIDCEGTSNGPYLDPYGRDISDQYIQVRFDITIDTYLAQVVGWTTSDVCVEAIARAKDPYRGDLFYGNAVVGLDPGGLSYLAQSNAQTWTIRGGGVFANNDAIDAHGNVVFPDGHCVTAVGEASGFIDCTPQTNQVDSRFEYPDEVRPLLPSFDIDNCDSDFCPPPCDGTAVLLGDGLIHPDQTPGFDIWRGSRVATFENQYAPGLYCIEDAGGVINSEVTGDGVTFYFLDHDFTMKYAGEGAALVATAPDSSANAGPYENLLMFSDVTSQPCTQNIELRGNGLSPISGTVFLPSACINYLGNSLGALDYVQLIGYQVYSNGTSDVEIYYNEDDQAVLDKPALIELYK
ncbi:pilus assembly protein TadG-related protein [Chloroflexota bacterium]